MFYLFMAFGAVWLLVTLYLVYLGLRQRQLEGDLRALREELDSANKR
ncbi:MAG: CcmD family protein [Caldilineaceae bacterium]|nr:CcmD family protein [Caldilineaceae bacterium]